MDLITYMIITATYWTVAFYYPIRVEPTKKRIIIRLFWLPYVIFIILRWMRGKA